MCLGNSPPKFCAACGRIVIWTPRSIDAMLFHVAVGFVDTMNDLWRSMLENWLVSSILESRTVLLWMSVSTATSQTTQGTLLHPCTIELL